MSLSSAASILALAFSEDPALTWSIPDPQKRQRVLPWLFERNLVAYQIAGAKVALYPETHPRAVAVWLTGISPYVGLGHELRAGLGALPIRLGLKSSLRLSQLTRHWEAWRRTRVPGPHGYLALLAVNPTHQGRGYAGELLRQGLEPLQNQPVALETHRESNVGLYLRHGFELLSREPVGASGPQCFKMVRPRILK